MSVDKLKALQEQKGRIVSEQRSVIDKAETENNRAFTAEERSQFDRQDQDIADIDRKITHLQREESENRSLAEANEKADAEKRNQGVGEAASKAKLEAFDAYLRYGFANLSVEEKRSLGDIITPDAPINQRAQSVGTNTAGGYTVPRGFSGEMDKALKAFGGMLELGRTWTTGSGNPVDWPTFDDTASEGYILGENTDATTGSTDVAFGQKTLGAYTYTSGVIKISNQLLQDSAFDLSSLLVEALSTRLGRIQARHTTTGTGSGQPQGVTVGATAVTGAAATAITTDNIIDLIHSVDPAYRTAPGVKLTFNDHTLAAVRKLKDSYGQYIWTMGNIQTGVPSQVFGYQYIINQHLADIAANALTIGFGDFKRYIIRQVQDVLVRRLDERYAELNQVGFVGFMRMDGKLLNPNAVKFIQHAAS